MSPSDSEQSFYKTMQMLEAFRAAAAKCTGPGKPKFENLSQAFNALQDAKAFGVAKKVGLAEVELKAAMYAVQSFAKEDTETAAIEHELKNKLDTILNPIVVYQKPATHRHWHG